MKKQTGLSRRQFGQRAAMGASALSAAAVPLAAQTSDASALPLSDQATVDAKYANVIRKYGDRLSDAQRARAREIIVRHQRMLMRVRDFALENSDAPATGFRLYPSDVRPLDEDKRK